MSAPLQDKRESVVYIHLAEATLQVYSNAAPVLHVFRQASVLPTSWAVLLI